MARTSQGDTHPGVTPPVQQVGVWLQYKGIRARTLQTTKNRGVQAGLRSTIIDEFLADLEALKLTLPGLPMVDIRIVWGTGQIRANYGLKKEGLRFNVVIRYLVKRASTEFLDLMSERAIARLWYIEDGSQVDINKLALGRPSSLPSLRTPHARPQTSLPDKLLEDKLSNVPSSSQPLATSSSATFSHCALSAKPSLSSYAQPPADRLQVLPSAQRISCDTARSQACQAPPFQSPQAPVPYTSHRNEPSPHPIPVQPRIFGEEGIGRGLGRPVGERATISIAGPSMEPGPHQLPYEVLASPTFPLAAPDGAQSGRPLIVSQVSLTPDACSRLKDPADDAILAILPVVRVLVLRSTSSPDVGAARKSYNAFVTDGRHYMWLAFAQSGIGTFNDRDDRRSLQVGSAVRLKRMSRLSTGADFYTILVHDIEIIDSTSDIRSTVAIDNQPPNTAIRPEGVTVEPSRPQTCDDRPTDGTLVHNEHAALLLADAKFQEERRRRILLERALEDVCGDLNRLDSLYPAAAEVLRRIDRLTDAAAMSD